MKLFESDEQRQQGVIICAGIALHACVLNPNSVGINAENMVKKAFEIANEFLRQAEAL